MSTDDTTARPRMTDKRVMRRALLDAIDWRKSLIESYPPGSTEPYVAACKAHIAGFERVLDRYFGGVPDDPLANVPTAPLHEIMLRMETAGE